MWKSSVLNLNAMFFAKLALIFVLISQWQPPLPALPGVEMSVPEAGAVVQGNVSISGTLAAEGMTAYEILFGYAETTADQAFLLAQGSQPVTEGELARWDTTLYTDGNYRLIIRLHFTDGSTQETVVDGLRVRNYSPVETATANPALPPDAATPTPAPTITVTLQRSTPTAFQSNPGSLTSEAVTGALIRGAGFSAIVVIFLAVYAALSRRNRR